MPWPPQLTAVPFSGERKRGASTRTASSDAGVAVGDGAVAGVAVGVADLVAAGVAAPSAPGITSSSPGCKVRASLIVMSLAVSMSSTDTPLRKAMARSVSPARTVYVAGAGSSSLSFRAACCRATFRCRGRNLELVARLNSVDVVFSQAVGSQQILDRDVILTGDLEQCVTARTS